MTKEIWRILNHFYFEKQNQQLHELVCDFAEDQHGINLLSVRDFKVVEKKKRERGKSQPGAPRQQSESPMPPHYEQPTQAIKPKIQALFECQGSVCFYAERNEFVGMFIQAYNELVRENQEDSHLKRIPSIEWKIPDNYKNKRYLRF